ncbi:hypothetical protein [Chryseobacterium salviniae]|uniref:DUF4329 domain-containing protein n=1 Tax=Chryseobacterium salviniae TaxID=3101750 RepID=A0ABU6HWJ8_9FLAO|nr:hypothetical protein [Chryseobacterium sp. T9W2-O]MEC3877429.1 hypothetical protein [Chryseobacterium sp. T9W2-O]
MITVTRVCEMVGGGGTGEGVPPGVTNPQGGGTGGGTTEPGGSNGSANTSQPCDGNGIISQPQDPSTTLESQTGCNTGTPTLPNLGENPFAADPCEKAQIPVSNANAVLHEPNISGEMAIMKSHAANANVEYGTAIINIGSSTVAQDPYTDNEPVKVNIHIPSVGDYIANAHTHPCHGVSAPSLGDFYGDIKHVKDYPTFQGGYIFSCNGSVYAFIVEDRQKAIDFLNTFPEAENLNPNRQLVNEKSQLGIDFNNLYEDYMQGRLPSYSGNGQTDALESALAQVLEKYNSGMILAKSDSNGNLKPLKPVKFQYTIPASGGKKITGYKAVPCP